MKQTPNMKQKNPGTQSAPNTSMTVLFVIAGLSVDLANDELGRVIQGDVDPSNIFADEAQHEHDHAADKQEHGHEGAVSDRDIGIDELMDDGVDDHEHSQEGTDNAAAGSKAQRLDGKGGKTVHPEREGFAETVVAHAYGAFPLFHLHVHYIFGRAQHETGQIGIGVLVLDHFVLDEALHDREIGKFQFLVLAQKPCGDGVVDFRAEILESGLGLVRIFGDGDVGV